MNRWQRCFDWTWECAKDGFWTVGTIVIIPLMLVFALIGLVQRGLTWFWQRARAKELDNDG